MKIVIKYENWYLQMAAIILKVSNALIELVMSLQTVIISQITIANSK